MLLFWRIRYLDTRDKQFKDRDLWLDTCTLDNITKTAVELAYELSELREEKYRREMLRHRHLFCEIRGESIKDLFIHHDGVNSVFIHDYFEDETGKKLSNKRMATILTGNPDAIMLPPGAKQYDIDYILADKRPIPIDQISLSDEDARCLGYFTRDLREMLASAFYKNGPGTLSRQGGKPFEIKTSVTDEEIRSFITIFRRLYMSKEPANFIEAVKIFEHATQGYRLSNWIKGVKDDYVSKLAREPEFVPCHNGGKCPFTCKRLLDVFLYTQYAHQPDAKRSQQFQDCLTAVGNDKPLLLWLFLTELKNCSLYMRNAGVIIAGFYDRYCQYHKVYPDVLGSVADDHPGIGILEKTESLKIKLIQQKINELATLLWKNDGCPKERFEQYLGKAKEQIDQLLVE